jgi:hypothetical protein
VGKIRNISGQDRVVPGLNNRLVLEGGIVEVPDGDVYSYTCQEPNWKCADKAAEKAHKDGAKAEAARVAAERGEPIPAPEEG